MTYIDERGAVLAAAIREKTGNKVHAGPFYDMKLPENLAGNFAPYILGTYEHELHQIIREITLPGNKYQAVLNVGCSFGYYAVGLARSMPNATVWATDIESHLLDICAENALNNNVINVCCSSANRPIELSKNDLIVMDCEGAEEHYLDPNLYDFTKTDILVELHECDKPGIVNKVIDRFKNTHATKLIYNKSRYFNLEEIFYDAVQLEHFDNAIVTFEGRAGPTPWAWIKHK